MSAALQSFLAAMTGIDDETAARRAIAFWARLGDENAAEMGMDAVAMAKAVGGNPAADCLEQAAECGFDPDQIADAALFASRA